MLCVWGVKTGMGRVWCEPLKNVISERCKGQVATITCYTNPRLLYCTLRLAVKTEIIVGAVEG